MIQSRKLRLLFAGLSLAGLVGCGGGGGTPAPPPTHSTWTILVFMNAANDLDAYSTPNVAQMQSVATNPDVRIVVQWKQVTKLTSVATFNGTRRYLIKPNTVDNQIVSQLVQNMGNNVDMGVPQTLHDFVAWGQKNYPADHYALVVWDHGDGWLPSLSDAVKQGVMPPRVRNYDVSYDDQTGHSIDIWQFNQAFQGLHLDIVAFDASLMQMNEVAYQLIGYADYVAGSEESPPGEGYPYQRVFAEFEANPTNPPRTLAKAFVDGMIDEPLYNNFNIEESVVDPTQLPAVASAASTLAQAMVSNASALDPVIPTVRSNTQAYLPSNLRYFYDSVDLCTQLSAQTNIPAVQTACTGFSSAVSNAVIWEAHNANSPRSHGLSIEFSPSSFFNDVSSSYNQLAWNGTSNWSAWLSMAP